MKKYYYLLIAAAALVMAACGGKGQESSAEEDKAAEELAANGTVFEGANFSITYPKDWKETFKSDESVNTASEDNSITMDATFSDYPCKPADFEQYYKNFTGMSMNASYTFEQPVIEENIMTYKGVDGDKAVTNFVVYIDDKAGVAGGVKYPVSKAAEVEPMIKPILNSIKKK